MRFVFITIGISMLYLPLNAYEIAVEAGGRLGWRSFEKEAEPSGYLIRPSFFAGMSIQSNPGNDLRPEVGLYYKSLKDVREHQSGLVQISDSTAGHVTGESGIKQMLISIPITCYYSRPRWIIKPFIGLDGTYILSTDNIYDLASKDTVGVLIRESEGENDQTWMYKRFNVYLSSGVCIPFHGALKNAELKTSADFALFDAPKADTVSRKTESGSITVYFQNRFRMNAVSLSVRYKIF